MDINSMSSAYEPTRITGMASGLDVDSLVKKSLMPDQMKIDKVKQDEQCIAWKQEQMVDIVKDLKDFNNYFDILSPDNLVSSKNYAGTIAKSSDENQLKAETFAGAVPGAYKVYVNKVAKAAVAQVELTVSGKKATPDDTLASIGITGSDLNINVNGKEFNITGIKSTDKISDLVEKIKNSKTKDEKNFLEVANVSFSELTGKLTISTNSIGKNEKIILDGTVSDKLCHKNTKKDNELDISELLKNWLLHSKNDSTTKNKGNNKEFTGENASLSIIPPGEVDNSENRKKYTITGEKNNINVDNITYSIGNAKEGSSVTINVEKDATEGVKKIKAFVEKYNKLVEKIQGRLTEKQQFKYKPLSAEQKKSMSKEDAEDWNKKAQQGLLRNNMMLSSLLNDLRSAFYTKVNNAGLMITDLGISTTNNFRDGGKLVVDEKKLKNALENKGDQVRRLFTENGTGENSKGIFTLIKDRLEKSIGFSGNLIKEAGYKNSRWEFNNELSKKIKAKAKMVEDLQEKMFKRQEQLYKQFAQLEEAMTKASSQGSYLAGMMPS